MVGHRGLSPLDMVSVPFLAASSYTKPASSVTKAISLLDAGDWEKGGRCSDF